MSKGEPLKRMQKKDIPEFVRDVAATGCDIRAVGDDHYVVGDADLSPEVYNKMEKELVRISDIYGERNHLKYEIIAYLHSIGRSYPPPQRH